MTIAGSLNAGMAKRKDGRKQAENGNGRKVPWKVQYDEPFAEIVTIRPVMAAYALENAAPNRPVKPSAIEEFSGIMKDDDWALNGETIKFNIEGLMFDGRNRLTACVRSGKPFRSLVIYGLSINAMDTVDIGIVRSASDILGMNRIPYSNITAAAGRWCLTITDPTIQKYRTRSRVIQFCLSHRELTRSSSLSYNALGPSQSLVAAMHYIADHLMQLESEAQAMLEVFVNGTPSAHGCPLKAYREKLLRQRGERINTSRGEQLYGLINAWNKFRRGEQCFKPEFPKFEAIEGFDVDLLRITARE